MLLDAVIIVLGFIGLIWGADKFVFGASALARSWGVSPLMIGLTIVAFGTSAPEIFSSAASAWEGEPALAIGNALGSNLFNIGIALGIAALISPLKPPPSLISKEIPALLLVTVVTGVLLIDMHLGVFDSVILILVTFFFGYKLFRKKAKSTVIADIDDDELVSVSNLQAAAYLGLGLALLILSAEALVAAATSIAGSLGVTTGIIGLTIVALGTSLPELAASITCVLKGHHDLAIGNIVGSNILNLLAVLPFPGLLSPGPIEAELLYRDYGAVLILTLLLAFFAYRGIKRNTMITRANGACLMVIYVAWFSTMLFQLNA
jgi:cation:H+ antiporter